jgi:hypothetical protein
MGICYLCKKDKKLIKAHIIPKWAYMYLYPEIPDEDNRSLILVGNNKKPVKRPIGIYDPEILCENCDNFFGKYDEYGKEVLLDAPLERRSEETYVIKNVDFEKLRIFLLSVLWRAGISNRPECERVSLGPYQEKIKEIFIDIQNGVENFAILEYSFFIGKYTEGELPSRVVNKNIQIPHCQKLTDAGINTVILYMPRGLKIFIKVDRRSFFGDIKKIVNYTKEGLIVPILGDYASSHEFTSLMTVFRNKETL